eukprot:CAMPEP_0197829502 /NCGR_PEP_ID=MMETSP1437-20131217/5992_1 /TAXON_ID=49252 ORGANISM="Eucampia antarctica, Strain CCMP1452" /NCGR_SAMPLE_ID=MMETSP1437 /ASSEMBLY_ACC=CAM_ASM_001096 /LENGTH=459 /DNA_ID=CAMNT_0043431235 /DNA_START=115 /DNA_END=1494 /DNA_ORIENTATION=+
MNNSNIGAHASEKQMETWCDDMKDTKGSSLKGKQPKRFSFAERHTSEKSKDQVELSYDELKAIEKTRRELLRKVEDPSWKIVSLNYHGTVLSIIVTEKLIWFTLIVYVGMRIWSRHNTPDEVLGIIAGASHNITAVNTFISFFLVFFVVGNNQRFEVQYDLCMAAKGSIMDMASLAKAYLPRGRGLRMIRYMNASYTAGFVGLSEAYTLSNYFIKINKDFLLLNEAELSRIEDCDINLGGSAYREIVQWVQKEVVKAQRNGEIDPYLANQMRELILNFQGSMSKLYNFKDQPIIFFYIHLLTFVSVLYLPLFALYISYHVDHKHDDTFEIPSMTADVVAGLVVFLQSIFVIGLRILGQKLSDPFGTDFEDLSVMFYVTFTYTQSGRIMAAEPPMIDDDDYALEEIIVRERKSIGFPWDTNDIQSDSESVDTVVRKNADGIKNPAGTHAFGHFASQTSPA